MPISLVKLTILFLAAHLSAALWFVLDRTPGTAAAFVGLPLDDAWIHLVYARSLAALQGFAYNPGQLETGSTSPLWAALLVPASLVARVLSVSVVIPAKVTGVLTATFASLGAARVVRVLGYGRGLEIGVGLLLAVDPMLAFAQVSGMEILLAAGLALWAFVGLFTERYGWAALASGLAALARPEMVLVCCAVVLMAEWRLHQARASWHPRVVALLYPLGLIGGWMTYCAFVSGYPLPNTFYAKFASQQDYLVHNLGLLGGEVLPSWPWFSRGAGFALWAWGTVVLFRRGLLPALFAGFGFLFLVAVASSQLSKEALPFYWQRYYLPAAPFILLVMAVGAERAVGWGWRHRGRAWGPVGMAAVALLLLLAVVDWPRALRQSARLYAWNCQNIEELDVAMAKWLASHVPAGEAIAVTDAGAARYFGAHPIRDMLGLNNHRLLHGGVASVVSTLGQVRTVVAFPASLSFIPDSSVWREVHRVRTDHLTICRCPQSELAAYRRDWPANP
jgi:hypothetical protein